MKIYTKTGDRGETSLFGGTRVPKDSFRIDAYGTIDELNSVIGFCRSLNSIQEIDDILGEIQDDLFTIGADLATPHQSERKPIKRIQQTDISRLEQHIDEITPKLEPLTSFILPGGSRSAALIHVARTICRRAERLVVTLARQEPIGEHLLIYLNRLSDLLFIVARRVNALSSSVETKWNPS